MQKVNHNHSNLSDKNQCLLENLKILIEEGNFDEAIRLMENGNNNSAYIIGIQAMVYFLMEEYDLAAKYYRNALQLEPANQEWQEMLLRSEANLLAEIDERVPPVYFFKDKNKEEPIQSNSLMTSKNARKEKKQFSGVIGAITGSISTYVIKVINWLWGRLADYRDDLWTNWYRKPLFLGILTLGYMRTRLNKYNLISTYPEGYLVGFPDSGNLTPPPGIERFRTANGSWNNLNDPLEGAARTRFLRNTAEENVDHNQKNLLVPNPRQLSLMFLTRKDKMKEVPFLNMLSVAWIQFQNHGWISYGEPLTNEAHEIPLAKDDPARMRFHQTKLLVGKTQKDPWRVEGEKFKETYINECSHWWDGSQIYGSDQKTQDGLRLGKQGKMKILDNGLLPRDKKGIEKTGFVRNWWVGLSMMHTLFVREHNSICDLLIANHHSWDDHQLFQTARLINSALMAKIHSVEWNAAINPNKALYQGILSNWYGLLSGLMQDSGHKKTLNSFKIRNAELGGILGNETEKYDCPFGLTQEFVEVYRMHSLLPESLFIRSLKSDEVLQLPIVATRQAASGKTIDRFGMTDLFYSFGNQNPGQLVLNNYPAFMQELSIPGNPVYDLGAVDILRARERGVPRYNAFRRALGLHPIRTFEDLTSDPEHIQLLRQAYLDDVELIDLMIGALAEEHRPSNFAFGETIFQIFLLNATRRLQADRFFTSCYNAEYYSQEGLDWIDQNDMKSVLLRHFPALAITGLSNIENAFEPWDEGNDLDPKRHPLRAFEKSLRDNPWKPDAMKSTN